MMMELSVPLLEYDKKMDENIDDDDDDAEESSISKQVKRTLLDDDDEILSRNSLK